MEEKLMILIERIDFEETTYEERTSAEEALKQLEFICHTQGKCKD